LPSGVRAPMPVMTTRRRSRSVTARTSRSGWSLPGRRHRAAHGR
jgi:hypothetical protein